MAKTKVPSTPPSSTTDITLTPEEMAAVMAARESLTTGTKAAGHKELADALITAIESTRPPAKKTSFNRPKQGPWMPKDGRAKAKLRRKSFQHGIELQETSLHTEEIELLNKLKPGSYCAGFVRVIKRKDRGIDVDYPIRTASQRLRLVNQFGIRSFKELLERLIAEAADPNRYRDPDDED